MIDYSGAIKKVRLSIDQCFLSSIVNEESKAQKLSSALEDAHAKGSIICPIHFEESILESSHLPEAVRRKILTLQNHLSDGLSFLSFEQILCWQTLALVTPGLLYSPIRQLCLPENNATDFGAVSEWHTASKAEYVDRLKRVQYPPVSYRTGMSGEEVCQSISAERSASMYRILEALKTTGSLNTNKSEWEYAEAIGYFLHSLKIEPSKLDSLIQKVLHRDWENMPQLWAHTRLNAQLEFGYLSRLKKPNANDALDLSRIAVALNHADVLLCDTAMNEIIKQSKVLEIFNAVKVFPMRQCDEAALIISTL